MAQKQVDIFIIGGGINGCGIARDAAGRGYSVFLAEMNDFGSGTSSWSTKLVHGGLRYLEHFEFRLVREALKEREVLWKIAPHIIWPIRFILPYHKALRPAWLLRIGLFLYDHIGGRKMLPATKVLDLKIDDAGKPLKPDFVKAFEYSDCWVNDARLVVLNAMDAADRGAIVKTRTKVISARRIGGRWEIVTEDQTTGKQHTIGAKFIVNAAGPWVDIALCEAFGRDVKNVRMVKGSHIIIEKKFEHERAYIFQNGDGRIIFAIPYEFDFTLVGTTDEDFTGDPSDVKISNAEIEYLCKGASEYFREPVTERNIVWNYSGVRPLYDDGASKAQEITRDYVLKAEGDDGEPQLVNIFGGKITTYRKLAEAMLELVEEAIGAKGAPWTRDAILPGGDFSADDFAGTVARLRARYGFLEDDFAKRLIRLYGTKAWQILGEAETAKDLGRIFGPDLSEAEIEYLIHNEWAQTADDVLWRRTKRGLRVTKNEAQEIERFMAKHTIDYPAS